MPIFQIRPERDRPKGWEILSFTGIHFFVLPSFFIPIGVIMLLGLDEWQTIPNAWMHAIAEVGLFSFIIFFSLLAHEAGHAIAARIFGYRDIYVTLNAFGGLTRHPPATRGQSLVITLAGPAMTLVLAGAAWGLGHSGAFWMQREVSQFLAANIFRVNLVWAVFNLLPIFPMDGGRSVLYTLTFLMKAARALLWTAIVSLAMCAAAGAVVLSGKFGPPQGQFLILYFLIVFLNPNIQILRDHWRKH